MKKFYEAPSVEITAAEATEDILAVSKDVVIDISSLFDTVDAGTEA